MKTFRRYLLSYVSTLLVPITILSIVIMQIITNYCGTQIIASNVGALEQLDTALDMQLIQLDAYTVQTSQRSEFFARTLRKTGSFYEVQRVLSRWMMASSFVDAVYFHNTALDNVYAYNGVYPTTYFDSRMASEALTQHGEIARLLQAGQNKQWLSLNDTSSRLFYLSSVRMTTEQRCVMLYEIDREALNELATNSSLYPESSTFIYLSDGTPLYTSGSAGMWTPQELSSLFDHSTGAGTIRLDGKEMLYARLPCDENGLVFVSVVPERIANAPIYRLWMSFGAGLFLIFAVGGTVIAWVMRVNYTPLRRLNNAVLNAQVLSEHTDDALLNVRNALQAMQSHNQTIARRTEALSKERLILRLLLGGYASAEAFNADGESRSLRLTGDRWHVALLLGEGAEREDEDYAVRLVAAAQQAMQGALMYLEVPENHGVVFIVEGEALGDVPGGLEASLAAQGLTVRAFVSETCSGVGQIAGAYARLVRRSSAAHAGDTNEAYPHEMYEALKNSLEFGETERIDFALDTLKNALPDMARMAHIGGFLYDVLHLVQSWLEARGDTYAVEAVRELARSQTSAMDPVELRLRGERILERIGEVLASQIKNKRENQLLQEIEMYLNQNFRDESFTVQRVADHFKLSISNLSHYFKNHIGVSVSEYVEQLRIRAARELLRQTEMSVADIAHTVGYAQPATFMRAFKKVCGVSPTGFRNGSSDSD